MKFKEFSKWCNERACDGCWGLKEAMYCIGICETIYNTSIFRRKSKWKELEPVAVEIVDRTNKKIEEVLGGANCET